MPWLRLVCEGPLSRCECGWAGSAQFPRLVATLHGEEIVSDDGFGYSPGGGPESSMGASGASTSTWLMDASAVFTRTPKKITEQTKEYTEEN